MNHEELQDLLESYVDETLDRTTRAEVDRHLAGCDNCRAILDGVPAVHLGAIEPVAFDDRAMRRLVRVTLLKVAANAVLIAVAGLLVVTLLGWLVFQPLVVNRGGRGVAATQATQDLAVMYNPGAGLTEVRYDSGIITRTTEVSLVIPIGTELVELATVTTRLGPFSFGDDGSAYPLEPGYGGSGDVADQLVGIGDGTVATVELQFDPPIPLERARGLAASPLDVRVVWVGFATSGTGAASTVGLQPDGFVGYGTCDIRSDADSLGGTLGGSSGMSGHSAFSQPPSIDRALDATRAAVDDLLDHPELATGWDPEITVDSMVAARDHLAGDPGATTLVVTGPTPDVERFLAEADPAAGAVRGIDFTNWQRDTLCGR
jgi:hypothetical protein